MEEKCDVDSELSTLVVLRVLVCSRLPRTWFRRFVLILLCTLVSWVHSILTM